MPVIRITDATWDRLKRWAVPLEDSPEDAVRKVLDAAEEHLKYPQYEQPASTVKPRKRSNNGRLPRGQKTPQAAYYQPILEAIYELGGSGSIEAVLTIVEKKVKDLLTDVDYQKLPKSGYIRWVNTAQWARFDLVKDGLLKSSDESSTGVWVLTDAGRQQAEKR